MSNFKIISVYMYVLFKTNFVRILAEDQTISSRVKTWVSSTLSQHRHRWWWRCFWIVIKMWLLSSI